jgi:hypothetical protein
MKGSSNKERSHGRALYRESAPKYEEREEKAMPELKMKKKCKKIDYDMEMDMCMNKMELEEEEDDKFEKYDDHDYIREKTEPIKEEKVEFNNKELILTQDIFDGFWKLNPQTNLLIEKQKLIYEKIEKILKNKNLDKEEIKVTLLVLYYLNTDNSINKIEYSLIMKKGYGFREKNGINFEEIFNSIKN